MNETAIGIKLVGDTTVNEGDIASYTIELNKMLWTDMTIKIVTGHIQTDNGDYVPVEEYITIPAGSTSYSFTVNTIMSNENEPDETFNVTISDIQGGGYEETIVTNGVVETVISDQDTTPPDAPTITITEDTNNDGILTADELDGGINVSIGIPAGVVVDDVLRVTNPDGSTTDYSVTQDMIDNGLELEYDAPENGVVTINAVLIDQAGNISLSGMDSVNIDPVPTMECEAQHLEVYAVNTNLVLTLDLSTSMNQKETPDALSRLELTQNATKNMINAYAQDSTVNVQITTFNGTAQTSVWMDVNTALAYVDSISAGGWTNYEAAIDSTVDNFTLPNDNARTIAYFISDGEPLFEMNDSTSDVTDIQHVAVGDGNDTAVDSSYVDKWSQFVEDNVDSLHVIGIGPNITQTQYLELIAGNETTVVYADDAQIDDALVINSISGNLLDNITWGINADGTSDVGSIRSIEMSDGSVYNSVDYTGINTFAGPNGELKFDFQTGEYVYINTQSNAANDYTEMVKITVADSTGDEAQCQLAIDVDIIDT
ncbi:MAG: VWA domain-containing protein, partial [Campylobacterota bacterium]|nr:VWA domain-containing protein [Campylobacterota bacterium]